MKTINLNLNRRKFMKTSGIIGAGLFVAANGYPVSIYTREHPNDT